MMRRTDRENPGTMKPGQELVVAGYAGFAGTRVIVREQYEQLAKWFSNTYLDMILDVPPPEYEKHLDYRALFGATECEAAGEGGILTTLWNLSGAYETGITFTLRKIPVRQETIEICERFACNPYRLYAKGCYLMVADNGGKLVADLAEAGIVAAVIGNVNSTIAREILSVEGRGFLERPQPDEIEKAVPNYVFNAE